MSSFCFGRAPQRSVDLNPAQKDLILKVAELLCSKSEPDSRAKFWVDKAAKLLPGSPAAFNLKVSFVCGSVDWCSPNRLMPW